MYYPKNCVGYQDRVEINFDCPMCHKKHKLVVSYYQHGRIYKYYRGYGYAQDIGLAPKDAEKLISGYCDDCQKILFGTNEEEE